MEANFQAAVFLTMAVKPGFPLTLRWRSSVSERTNQGCVLAPN